jgi:DNA-binding ferritin-like protein
MESIFPKAMLEKKTSSLTIESIIEKLFYFQIEVQMLHWKTKNYAEHKATGNLYEYIVEFKDDVVEKIMGYTGTTPITIAVFSYKEENFLTILSRIQDFSNQLKMYGEKNGYHDVCNKADELSGMVAKTKYLSTLS